MYIILPLILLLWYALASSYYAGKKSKKALAGLRMAWGKPKSKFEAFNFDRISAYALHTEAAAFHRLSQQTLLDIDFEDVFAFIDRTTTRIGQQYFFNRLIHPLHDPAKLESRDENIQFFIENHKVREEIQLELLDLAGNDSYHLATLFRPILLLRPTWLKYMRINILVSIACLLLSIEFPVMLVALMFSLAINILVHYWNKRNIYQYILSFAQLNTAIDVCRRILQKGSRFEDAIVREGIKGLKEFQLKLNLLDRTNEGGLRGDISLVFTYFIELLKAACLIEVFTLFELTKKLEFQKQSIKHVFDYLGELDTTISIASLRSGSHATCKPTFLAKGSNFEALNIYHPLIENCSKNDLASGGKGLLVTGSNMSGKTTFLRTLVINSILAQTIDTCFADEFKTPIVRQFSSIRIDDNLLDGKSYYYEEVSLMGKLIEAAASGDQGLFVLDEVFKGTNTNERIAASKAILSYLKRNNNIVVVSTHDIELANMLLEEYDLYHFTEVIEGDQLKFDHKLKAGILKTTNAIKILELSGYPVEIIEEAKAIAAGTAKA
ncbi:MAG: DNA mismatch repair protein MutS [Chryseolinea sp.]